MKKLFSVVASVVTVLAIVAASTASAWVLYQPKAPKSLTK